MIRTKPNRGRTNDGIIRWHHARTAIELLREVKRGERGPLREGTLDRARANVRRARDADRRAAR